MPTASIQNWQLSVQRELFKDLVLDVAYVGNRADDTVLLADLNQARPVTQAEFASGTMPLVDARRPIAGFGSISAVLPEGFSNYNALQVKLERRFSKGLYVLKSRGTAHSNQIREFLITSNGVQLVEVEVGSGGVLIGSARARRQAAEKERLQDAQTREKRREADLARKLKILEAQIGSLRAAYEAEEEELARFKENERDASEFRIDEAEVVYRQAIKRDNE